MVYKDYTLSMVYENRVTISHSICPPVDRSSIYLFSESSLRKTLFP